MNKPRNIADKAEVAKTKRKVKDRRNQELNDIRTVLSTVSGRRLLWRMMEHTKTFGSIWEPSAKIHYNSGKQDVGHFIMAEIMEADPNLFMKMMKEKQKGDKNNE